jgi:hypothetical protein
MSHVDRAIPAALALALGLSLSGCSSAGPTFDPTDWISGEWFAKPPLAGDRKAVFPNGVPGVPEGVPSELLKGNQQAAAENLPAPAEQAEAPKPAPKPAVKPATRVQTVKRTSTVSQQTPAAAARPASQQATQSTPPAASQNSNASQPDASTQANWPPPSPDTFSR